MALDSTDKRLLEALQRAFPLEAEPFQEVGRGLGVSAPEALARVEGLKAQGIIREIGGIFDSRALGYESSLVALSVSPERLEAAAAVISGHPGVSHNYAREHEYNLWFTLALPPGQDMAIASQRLANQAGAQSVLVLPALRVFKIGAYFRLLDDEGVRVDSNGDGHRPAPTALHMTPAEIALVRELQEDLPLVEWPFQGMAQRLGMDVGQVLAGARDFLSRGLMRRFAAMLHHRQLGFLANGMACWVVPPPRLEEVGQALAAFPQVTHCYQRVTYPQWPYNLFTMVHGRSQEECQAIVRAMASKVDIKDYIVLFSTKEFKKARVKYYW